MKVWLLRILGFIIGTVLAFAFEFALLLIVNEVFEVRLLPRGIDGLPYRYLSVLVLQN